MSKIYKADKMKNVKMMRKQDEEQTENEDTGNAVDKVESSQAS